MRLRGRHAKDRVPDAESRDDVLHLEGGVERVVGLEDLDAAEDVGLGFAAVPLYNLFCRVTGFGGTTQRYDPVAAAETPKVLSDTVSVRFDANVSPKLPWKLYPEHPTDTVSIGARDMAIFIAQNN